MDSEKGVCSFTFIHLSSFSKYFFFFFFGNIYISSFVLEAGTSQRESSTLQIPVGGDERKENGQTNGIVKLIGVVSKN